MALEAVVQKQEQFLKAQSDEGLVWQANKVVTSTTNHVFHDPDTVEHFETFSVEKVISELQTNAPDIYRLFQNLGDIKQVLVVLAVLVLVKFPGMRVVYVSNPFAWA